MTPDLLPEWADRWVPGRCGCGARLCMVACYCGGHIACSANGTTPEACSLRAALAPDTGHDEGGQG